ncbi:glycosyltransferase family 2 protein [Olsenella sp. An188]|uniref:glycosyltransferase family 2 protein n=1 Tax=Olsenella sp. An188 TaxID=1965579 RepID=UPI000B3831FC|nr:glycosyltransferase family 2 protein [Olsenella sp. An188]OUP38140.1 hypothetical protein B5F23_07820 [Olsenella sp. An188]
MSNKPEISVVIPIYNVEKYMRRCVDSVLQQEFDNAEIILVDDGSTDQSGVICDQYAADYDTVRVIHQRNKGLSGARNAGIDVARGEWITFIDGDDVVSTHLLFTLFELANKYDAEIVSIDPEHIAENEEPEFCYSNQTDCYDYRAAILDVLYQDGIYPSACGKLYRTKIFDKIRFPEGKLFEDIAVMGPLFEGCSKIVWNKSRLYGYVHRKNSITNRIFDQRDCDILEICDQYCERYRKDEILYLAAKCYRANCSLRVLLRAPIDEKYQEIRSKCSDLILNEYTEVLNNRRARTKLKLALILFRYARPLLYRIYPYINRWK